MKLPSLAPLHISDLKDHGEELKKSIKKRAGLAKGSVVNLLHTGKTSSPSRPDAGEVLPARPVYGKRTPAKRTVPALDISDDILNRMFVDSPRDYRRPTSKFFHNQRLRAGMDSPVEPLTPPRLPRLQARHDRKALSAEDLIYMFAGAPYFDIEHTDGHAQPRVVFGWGPSTEESKHASDTETFAHRTFELSTRDRTRRSHTNLLKDVRHVREVPSMRSANGKDPGTIGYSHFLELQSATPLEIDLIARRQRQQLIVTDPNSLGLREHNLENVLYRLAELSRVFEMLHDGDGDPREWSANMIEEIGEDLFTTLLSSDLGTTSAGTGSVSLITQVSALQKVLGTTDLWFDFSGAEERALLPHVLWSEHLEEEESAINEREILMLQIALSAELAVRLEIATRLTALDVHHQGVFASGDLDIITSGLTDKLLWDIALFRRFIYSYEGIITNSAPSRPESLNPLHRLSWNSAMRSEASATSYTGGGLLFKALHDGDQADGLQTFADSIGWMPLDPYGRTPLIKSDSFLSPPAISRPVSGVSEYDTPATSPTLARQDSNNLEYDKANGGLLIQAVDRNTAEARLARSWNSGFVMPGESVSEMLLDALLERTFSAKHIANGPRTDGFVFNHKMFWSRNSIASRVMAPALGAQECMGWTSLPFVPRDTDDGWIRISTQPAPATLGEPRMSLPDAIANASDPLRSRDASTLQTSDFQQPVDGFMVSGNEAQFDSLSMKAVEGPEPSFTLSLAFSGVHDRKQSTLNLRLAHAVHFVSSYPCFPYTKRRRQPTSPAQDSFAPTDSGRSTPVSSPRDKELPLPPAHPLHVGYTFIVIPAAALLSSANKDSDELTLYDPDEDRTLTYQIQDQEVVVLDCRGSPDLEVLARAWCSKVGEDALIGKGGRTCIACCIREAMALGIGVVIRT